MITCNTYSTHFLNNKHFHANPISTNISFRFSCCQKHSDSNLYSERRLIQDDATTQSGSIYADVSQARLKHFHSKLWHASPSGKVHSSSQKYRVEKYNWGFSAALNYTLNDSFYCTANACPYLFDSICNSWKVFMYDETRRGEARMQPLLLRLRMLMENSGASL